MDKQTNILMAFIANGLVSFFTDVVCNKRTPSFMSWHMNMLPSDAKAETYTNANLPGLTPIGPTMWQTEADSELTPFASLAT